LARRIVLLFTLLIASARLCFAQDLQPRRWSHLPIGLNFAGLAYAYTEADISDSPALRLEDVKMELNTLGASYVRTFKLFGKSARIDLAQAYLKGHWEGLLDGKLATTSRSGWSDTTVRFAMNILGAPPLQGKEFGAYRKAHDPETIVGIGLAVQLPTGDYKNERLINLGSNRFTFKPQIGVVHSRQNWSMELTGTVWLFTDNDEFFGDNKLEQDPFYTLQGHLIYTFRPGLWAGLSGGLGHGSQTTLNGQRKDDQKEAQAWAASIGYPLSRDWGVKFAYIGTRRRSSTGTDTDSLVFAVSHFW